MTKSKEKSNSPDYVKVGHKLMREIDDQLYEVNPMQGGNITYLPGRREDRVKLLKKIITIKLQDRWMKIPKKLATLERQAIMELIDSL